MIDERFSADSFQRASHDSTQSARLADGLAQEVSEAIQERLEEAVAEVVAQLNAMGHHLHQHPRDKDGEFNFYDWPDSDLEPDERQTKRLSLRLHLDFTSLAASARASLS